MGSGVHGQWVHILRRREDTQEKPLVQTSLSCGQAGMGVLIFSTCLIMLLPLVTGQGCGGMGGGEDPGLNGHCGQGICTSSVFIRGCSFCPGLEMPCWSSHMADCLCNVKP